MQQFTKRRLEKGISDSISVICDCDDGLVLLFYNYVSIEHPLELCKELQLLCLENEIQGKFRIGVEGFNITCGGSHVSIHALMKYFMNRHHLLPGLETLLGVDMIEKFKELYFKPTKGCKHCFDNLSIKLVEEICPFGEDVTVTTPFSIEIVNCIQNNNRRDTHSLSPLEFHETLQKFKDDDETLVLDTRNYYETMFGYFQGAIRPPIRSFSQLPNYIKENKHIFENKKRILTYCTGGIRCEKASKYIASQTGLETFMLKGGIHNYMQEFDEKSLYQGVNYVFDARKTMGNLNQNIIKCLHCSQMCCNFTKCSKCHLVLPACSSCISILTYCCERCQRQEQCDCSMLLRNIVAST
jgi:UPF0176 protein